MYYRCNKVKLRGELWKCKIHLHYLATTEEVILFGNSEEHNHSEISTTTYRVTDQLKQAVVEAHQRGMRPKQIFETNHSEFPNITLSQITRITHQFRKQAYGGTAISIGELAEWCETNAFIPEDVDALFIVDYEIVDTEDCENFNSKFKFFISTKRLLSQMNLSNKLHVDATYKLNWNGFPLFVIGTTDLAKSFHCLGIALCENEKETDFEFVFDTLLKESKDLGLAIKFDFLISDAAPAIRGAFQKVFGEKMMVMCWAHMFSNSLKHIHTIADKKDASSVLNNI